MRSNAAFKMTFMRAWCLSYLIENAHQELIIREGVAYAVWGERSQFVSDANLTQLLYLLRRDLQQIGLFELFVTLPRQGIKNTMKDLSLTLLTYRHKLFNIILTDVIKIISIGIPTLFLLYRAFSF